MKRKIMNWKKISIHFLFSLGWLKIRKSGKRRKSGISEDLIIDMVTAGFLKFDSAAFNTLH